MRRFLRTRLSSGPDPKTERGPSATQSSPAVVATTVFSATMAATQLHSQYKPGPVFLSTIQFLRGPRVIYHARALMQSGRLRHGGHFAFLSGSPNIDIESLAQGRTFVNDALFRLRRAQRASAEGLADLGHTIMGARPFYAVPSIARVIANG